MTLREQVERASGMRLGAISDEDLIAAFVAFDSAVAKLGTPSQRESQPAFICSCEVCARIRGER